MRALFSMGIWRLITGEDTSVNKLITELRYILVNPKKIRKSLDNKNIKKSVI